MSKTSHFRQLSTVPNRQKLLHNRLRLLHSKRRPTLLPQRWQLIMLTQWSQDRKPVLEDCVVATSGLQWV